MNPKKFIQTFFDFLLGSLKIRTQIFSRFFRLIIHENVSFGKCLFDISQELRISKEAFVPIFDSRIDDNFHKIVLP